MATITTQQITVDLADRPDPIELHTANPDLVRWDLTRPKHNWPTMEEAPMLWGTFVAWACAKRTGAYDGTWEAWSERDCLRVDFDVEDAEPVDPTRTDPALSSA